MRPQTNLSNKPRVSLVKRTDVQGARGVPTARLGNSYLMDGARRLQILKIMQFVIVIAFVVLVALLAEFTVTRHRLFATTVDGKLTAPPPLDQEIGDNVVNLWLVEAMTKSLTMGFHDFDLRMKEIRPFFNDRGWESYSRFLRTSYNGQSNLRSLIENDYLTMSARISRPPQVIQRGLIRGVFTYQYKVDFEVTAEAASEVRTGPLTYEITVERVPSEINPAGIAISQWRLVTR